MSDYNDKTSDMINAFAAGWNIADHQSLGQHAKLKRAARHLDEPAVYFVTLYHHGLLYG